MDWGEAYRVEKARAVGNERTRREWQVIFRSNAPPSLNPCTHTIFSPFFPWIAAILTFPKAILDSLASNNAPVPMPYSISETSADKPSSRGSPRQLHKTSTRPQLDYFGRIDPLDQLLNTYVMMYCLCDCIHRNHRQICTYHTNWD